MITQKKGGVLINSSSEIFEGEGKTLLDHFGIDGTKIIEVERRHPEVAKQIPMSKRVM